MWAVGGFGQTLRRREAFAAGKHLVGEAIENGGSGGVSTYGRALKDQAALDWAKGRGPGRERATGAVGGLTEAEPGGEGDAVAVLRRRGGEIEHESGEAAGLEEEIGGAEGLVEHVEAGGEGVGRNELGRVGVAVARVGLRGLQRTQRSWRRLRPAAAADSASKAS